MLLANPSQFEKMFPDFELNSIPRNVVGEIFSRENVVNWTDAENIKTDNFEGLVFQIPQFVAHLNDFEILKKEMFYLETDGRFEKRVEKMIEVEEKHLWLNFGQIEQKSFPGLHKIGLKLSSLPFELNSFTSYGFQISESLRVVVCNADLDFG
jgi:hypothetical protein